MKRFTRWRYRHVTRLADRFHAAALATNNLLIPHHLREPKLRGEETMFDNERQLRALGYAIRAANPQAFIAGVLLNRAHKLREKRIKKYGERPEAASEKIIDDILHEDHPPRP